MRINNKRVSELPWDDEGQFETEAALRDADASVIGEAYAFVGQNGNRLGLHHEIVDNELILNREAVWGALSLVQRRPSAEGEENQPHPLMGIRRADRIKAMEHLRKHMEVLQKT